jgi:hypothetical protein
MLLKATAAGGGPAAIMRMDAGGIPVPPGLRYMLMNNDTEALVAAIDGMLAWPGIEALLPHVTVSCLVWAGTADVMHDRIRDGAAQIPTADFVSLPDLDHQQADARSDLVLPCIREFLAKVESLD